MILDNASPDSIIILNEIFTSINEFSNEYFSIVKHHLKELTFGHGVLISAQLIDGNISNNYTLRKHLDKKGNIVKRVFSKKSPSYTFYIDPRDESGAQVISEIENRGTNLAANALAQSTEHIYSLFTSLRLELSFYIGCLNLYQQIIDIGLPISCPEPVKSGNIKAIKVTIFAYVLFNLTYSIFSIPAGVIVDKIGAKKVLIMGLVLFSLVYFFLGLINKSLFIWLLFPVYGIYMALTEGVGKAYISLLVPQEKSGTAFGIYQTSIGICSFFSSLIAGVIWNYINVRVPFYFGSITALISAILFIVLGSKIKIIK